MNCVVLFLAQSKQFGELRTFRVFAVIKNIGTLCPFCNFRKPHNQKLIFLLMCHLFIDQGCAVDVCLFGLEPL